MEHQIEYSEVHHTDTRAKLIITKFKSDPRGEQTESK